MEPQDQRPGTLTLTEAVDRYVRPGASVYVGNFGAQLFCVGDELIRQGHRDLDVISGSGGLMLDKLIGAGSLRSALFAHCWNPVGPRPAYNLRRSAERGEPPVLLHELSLGMLALAFQAAAWDVPYLPVNLSEQTGYWTEDWSGGLLSTAESSFGRTSVVRAVRPDVAFVHVDTADLLGNCVLTTPYGEHLNAAVAATATVAVAEQVVADSRDLPSRPELAGIHVDAVVQLAGAARPDGVPGRYPRDTGAYVRYAERTAEPGDFAALLAELRVDA